MTSAISSLFAFLVHILFILTLIGVIAAPFVLEQQFHNIPASWIVWMIIGGIFSTMLVFGVIYVLLDIMKSLRVIKANSSYLAWTRANPQPAPAANAMPQRRA